MKGEIRGLDDIPNLMGFISQTEKTGVLTLNNKEEQIEVGFYKGKVNAAVHRKSGTQELIKTYLLNSGKISKNDYKKIQELHKETKKSYEDLLINEKYVDKKQWQEIIHFKIQDIFDELFRWEKGSYEFLEDIIMYENSSVKIELNTQGLIMEGMRRIDEWPNILSVITSDKLCFKLIEDKEIPSNLGQEERRLLDIINPSLTLNDLVVKSGYGKYITYQSIYNLIKIGIIKKVPRQRHIVRKDKKKKIKINFYMIFSWILLLLVIFITGIVGLISYPYTNNFINSEHPIRNSYIAYEKETIEYVLKMYFLMYNEYPVTLDELIKKKWISKEITKNYSYNGNKHSYTLIRH